MATSNLTSGFIDLATFDELEKYLYGGASATAYFVRETRKATWFTLVPVALSRSNGTADFGQDSSVNISRAGDYLVAAWLRLNTPSVNLSAGNQFQAAGHIRWTKNFMHNLIYECQITFNDLTAARFDSYHLDFWSAFTVPAGKLNGYNNMIGNFDDMTKPYPVNSPIPSYTLNLPLPFFFARDSGVALPTAALPYNEMRINYSFRNWSDLLILDNGVNNSLSVAPSLNDLGGVTPSLSQVYTWANYAIVSNDERKRMACAPRNILIEQVQTAPIQTFQPGSTNGGNPTPTYDLRFSHAIKVMFFAVRNATIPSLWSNYTAATPTLVGNAVNWAPTGACDPITSTSLTYENTARLQNMGSDYFSLVQPWYHAPVIPLDTGYHMYSYSLDFICLDPKGSTNYGKLTNVSIAPVASTNAISGANGSGASNSGLNWPQVYKFICTVVNNNIIKISGGALGFPVL
jgi:Large eukaryotic DNA virus major capsid protein/Major capsid protein N-terminus